MHGSIPAKSRSRDVPWVLANVYNHFAILGGAISSHGIWISENFFSKSITDFSSAEAILVVWKLWNKLHQTNVTLIHCHNAVRLRTKNCQITFHWHFTNKMTKAFGGRYYKFKVTSFSKFKICFSGPKTRQEATRLTILGLRIKGKHRPKSKLQDWKVNQVLKNQNTLPRSRTAFWHDNALFKTWIIAL